MVVADILASYKREGFFIEHIRRDLPYKMPQEHYHSQYEVYYLISGDRNIFIKDRIYHIKAGDFVLFSPDIIHRSLPASSPTHERLLIEFDFLFFEGFLLAPDDIPYKNMFFGKSPVYRPNNAEQQRIINSFMLLLNETQKRSPSQDFRLKTQFLYLLQILDTIVTSLPSIPDIEHSSNKKSHRNIQDIILYINENHNSDVGLETTAEHFKLSSAHLSRTFKSITGFTFTSYINQLRIRESQQLLTLTTDSIETIALKVGFQSSTHFGRVFRSYCGVTPVKYRKTAL